MAEQRGAPRKGLLTLDQQNSSSDIFISISGLIGTNLIRGCACSFTFCIFIGAGKTTLATKLAEKMGLPCFYEPVIDNMYLADFYRDPKRYSFPLQVNEGRHCATFYVTLHRTRYIY